MTDSGRPPKLARVLLGAAVRLLAEDLAPWGAAMEEECARTPRDKALGFAAGCLVAALRIRIAALGSATQEMLWPATSVADGHPGTTVQDALYRPRLLGLACGAGAVLLGAGYLAAAGAPFAMSAVNLGALVIGAAVWFGLGGGGGRSARGLAVLLLSAPLVLTALFGVSVEGASRWAAVGPFTLQVSLITVPAMLVLFARKPDAAGALGMTLAAAALAAQPDRGMAGAFALTLVVLVAAEPSRWVGLSAAAAAAGFGWTLVVPDRVAAAPFVDGILQTAFEVNPLAGAGVWIGAALLIAPALPAVFSRSAPRGPLLAFGAGWAAILAAAALGDQPTPLVGYGGAAVLGYLLSAALLPVQVSASIPSPKRSGAENGGTEPAACKHHLATPSMQASRSLREVAARSRRPGARTALTSSPLIMSAATAVGPAKTR